MRQVLAVTGDPVENWAQDANLVLMVHKLGALGSAFGLTVSYGLRGNVSCLIQSNSFV